MTQPQKKLSFPRAALPLFLLLSFAMTGCIFVTDDGDSSFTVVNRSDYVISELYITEVDNRDWGIDYLYGDALFPDERITVSSIACDFYDILLVDELGAECELNSVDLCFDDASWVITNSTLSRCPIFAANAALLAAEK